MDAEGKPIRVWLPTYIKEVYHLGNSLDDLYYGEAGTAGRYLAGKLNPSVQVGSDLLTNRTYPDTQVRNPDDPLGQQARDVLRNEGSSLLPFTIQNTLRQREAGASATSAGGLSSFGITPVPRSMRQSPFENYVDRKLGMRIPDAARTTAEAERYQKRREAITDLRSGKSVDVGGLTREDLGYITREAKRPALADRAMRLSLPELVDGLRYATPDEKRELFEVINAKLKNLKRLPPEQQQHVVNQLNASM
jgi:hypothetical protein